MTNDPIATADGGPGFCSRLSAERGLALIGSAGCYQSVLAFELDSPWTPKLAGSRASDAGLDAVIAAIGSRAKSTRLLALEPSAELRASRGAGHVRVLHFTRAGEPFSAYVRRQYDIQRERLAETLAQLAGLAEPAELAELAPRVHADHPESRDILVCTHGARDACCGKFGYAFYLEMQRAAAAPGEDAGVRVWRTSHLGGHRFAPTLLDLPSGRMFGRLRETDARVVLDGGASLVERLPEIYRGRCAIPEPAQIVERELWRTCGASFETRPLRWNASERGDAWDVRVEADGLPAEVLAARVVRDTVEAVVTPASCGRDPEPEAPWSIVE